MTDKVADPYGSIKKGTTVKVRFYDESDLLHCVTGTFVGATNEDLFVQGHDGIGADYEICGWMIDKERVDVCQLF